MSEEKGNQYEIGKAYYVKYDGSNMTYKEWSEKSEAMTATRMEGCWAAVENNYETIIEKAKDSTKVLSDDEKKKLRQNKKAVEYLTLCLQKSAYRAIRKGKGNAYEINAYLKKRFYKQTLDEMVTIEDKMTSLSMREEEDPSNIAEELEKLNDHLADIDKANEKTDQQMISIFLNKLPKNKYLTFVEGIRGKELSKLKIDEVIDKATDYWERNIKDETEDETKVFNTQTNYKPKFMGRCRIPWCRRKGHRAIDCYLNPKSKNCRVEWMKKAKKEYYEKKNNSGNEEINYDDVTCFKCGEKGHKSNECPNESKANNVQSLFAGATCIEETNVPEHNWNGANFDNMFDNFSYDNAYQVNNVNYGDLHEDEEEFAADTAASDHFITNNKHMYNKVEPTKTTAMTTDGKKTNIDETGNVDLISESGAKLTLNGANCAKKFKKNLISVARCVDDG